MANKVKIVLQNTKFRLPLDRELVGQIHSIRKKVTETKFSKFDAEENNQHHGDKFWSLALSTYVVDDDDFFREDISYQETIDVYKDAGINYNEMFSEEELKGIADNLSGIEDFGGKDVLDDDDFDFSW